MGIIKKNKKMFKLFVVLLITIGIFCQLSYQNTDVSEKTKQMINDNDIVVFSKSYCPYCKKAKTTLEQNGYEFLAYELDQNQDGKQIQQYLQSVTHQRTVPNVWVKGNHLGGSDDTVAAVKNGKLKQLLDGARAELDF